MLKKNEYKGTYKLKKPKEQPYKYHETLDFMKKTPLIDHKETAKRLGVKNVFIKDEGQRIELKSFKILGVSWALNQYLKKQKDGIDTNLIFCGCTDGNHGRALAYMSQKLKKKCVIYVPHNTSDARIDAIKKYDATVMKTKLNYDETMELMDKDAKINKWTNISDTAYGEEDSFVPFSIMQGYSNIFKESQDQVDEKKLKFTHVFVQAGVGCLAGSCGYFFHDKKNKPKIICVEPSDADCYLASVLNKGKLTQSKGKLESLMNGLNCGLPSYASFPWVMNEYEYMMTIDDDEKVKEEMRKLHKSKQKVIAGESGIAGLVGLILCCEKEEWKKELGLDENSVILVVNSEADTDEELYKGIIEGKI